MNKYTTIYLSPFAALPHRQWLLTCRGMNWSANKVPFLSPSYVPLASLCLYRLIRNLEMHEGLMSYLGEVLTHEERQEDKFGLGNKALTVREAETIMNTPCCLYIDLSLDILMHTRFCWKRRGWMWNWNGIFTKTYYWQPKTWLPVGKKSMTSLLYRTHCRLYRLRIPGGDSCTWQKVMIIM